MATAYERLRFEVVRVDVPVFNLPRALDGLRLVQLSDIHVGDFMPLHEVRRAVEMANGLAPDVAIITGDFVTSAGDPLAECISELSRLKAPLGAWGCNGNHEIYAGAEDMAESLFRQHGMTLLRQSSAKLHWNGESFNLIGVDYQHDLCNSADRHLPSLNGAEGACSKRHAQYPAFAQSEHFSRGGPAGHRVVSCWPYSRRPGESRKSSGSRGVPRGS